MRITKENFREKFEQVNSQQGKNRVYYKLISFKTETNYQGINFKLAPNVLVAILIFVLISFIFIFLLGVLLKIQLQGLIYAIMAITVGYISYKLSVTLTEKIFKKQILEFSKLITEWKKLSK